MIFADANESIDHPFTTENLPIGDFIVEADDPVSWGPYEDCEGFIVERKEWSDFVSSYRSGHFMNQLRRMMEQPYIPVLLLEGNRSDAIRFCNSDQRECRRMLTSVIVNWQVQVAPSANPKDSVLVLRDFDDWIGSESTTPHSVRPTEKVPAEDRPQYIVEGLPSVGPTTAKALLAEFDNVRDIFTATPDDLQNVDGIGPKTAGKIVDSVSDS